MNALSVKVSLLVALTMTLPSVAAAASCVATDSEPGDTTAIITTKIDYAIAAISDLHYQTDDPTCVAANMRYLGLAGAEKAVPVLVSLLDYKVPPHSFGKPLNSDVYPAISALDNIGKPAVAPLIEALASKDNDSTVSRNAIDALMDMRVYRDDLNKPLTAVKQAAAKEKDPIRAAHLNRAFLDARNKWCRFSPCNE